MLLLVPTIHLKSLPTWLLSLIPEGTLFAAINQVLWLGEKTPQLPKGILKYAGHLHIWII